jgi:hypothetical protein
MTVRLRASVIPGLLALTGLSLTGLSLTACASQGTIGAATSSPAGNTSSTGGSSTPSSSSTASSAPTAPASGSSPAAPSSQDPSALASSLKALNSLWTDQGCKTALAGFSDYLYAEQTSELQGVAAIPGAIQKIRAGAQQTQKPQAAQAMNKMASDLQTMFGQAQQGQTPDKGPVKNDFQVMGNVCSQP